MDTEQHEYIKAQFAQLRSKEDLLSLLNYAKKIVYGPEAIPFELRHLTYHANPVNNPSRYKSFVIKKKSGGERIIHAPCTGLKSLLKCLNCILTAVFDPHPAAKGFVTGLSIVDNAAKHTGKRFVYNMDLKDFFPGIERGRIVKRLQTPPFNLNSKLAVIIAGLCCHTMEVERFTDNVWQTVTRNVLPQGAPTSPIMTNIICQRLDKRLAGAARKYGAVYTRYADDITFSSGRNIFSKGSHLITEVTRIIADQNFTVNAKKTRLQSFGYRQEVTGLVINEKVNVKRRYILEIRLLLHLWEKLGFAATEAVFHERYRKDKGHVKKGTASMIAVLGGKLDFLKMVRGSDDLIYQRLNSKYMQLKEDHQAQTDPMNTVAGLILEGKTEEAMEFYSKFKNNKQ